MMLGIISVGKNNFIIKCISVMMVSQSVSCILSGVAGGQCQMVVCGYERLAGVSNKME